MTWIVGIDEAGRGPLAGPVSIGIVCAPENYDFHAAFPGLNDSKKLSEKKREVIFEMLQLHVEQGAISYAVLMPTAQDIDTRGIAVVIRTAIQDGLQELTASGVLAKECKVFLDGSLSAPAEFEQETVIGGDALIPSIMLASIAAKVTRDRYMVEQAPTYPEYGFEKHKGYGTKAHVDALRTHGLSDIHRRSFIHLDRVHS